MEKQKLAELNAGDQFTAVLVVRKKELKAARESGDFFLSLELGDASGRIHATIWDDAVTTNESLTVGDAVYVEARVTAYRERLQLKIDSVRSAKPDEYDATDLIAVVNRNRAELWQEFNNLIDSIENDALRKLLRAIFGDDQISRGFRDAPGGKLWHHNYIGGLLEHTLNVTVAAERFAGLYEEVNRDLLVTAGLLHDIGKIAAYNYEKFIDFTDEGRLVGHIVIGAQWVREAMGGIEHFPKSLETELIHLILSHQGKLEHASPVVPMTLEGLILYYADELDSKANAFLRIKNKEKRPGVKWSSYIKLINQYYYFGNDEE